VIVARTGVSDDQILEEIIDFVKAFSQVTQMAIEKIPVEETNKQDQASFRQEILISVNKILRKVFEKMQQVISLCFSNTHKDSFFPSNLY
jgi:hypothetical protein